MSVTTKEVAAPTESPDWYALLEDALSEPGRIQEAYRLFSKYSLCNRLLAARQLRRLGVPLCPINTFKGWLAANRPVRKGETAKIALVMPLPIKKKKADAEGGDTETVFTLFKPRRGWFYLDQTDGEEFLIEQRSLNWDLAQAKELLELTEIPFASVDGTLRGYAVGRQFAVSPLDRLPARARFREMGAILLGHTAATGTKEARHVPLESALREIEAETVAYLCCATLGFDGIEESRALLQELLAGQTEVPDKIAQRAFSAADKLLNAGMQ